LCADVPVEVLQCPHCQSDMVVELTTTAIATAAVTTTAAATTANGTSDAISINSQSILNNAAASLPRKNSSSSLLSSSITVDPNSSTSLSRKLSKLGGAKSWFVDRTVDGLASSPPATENNNNSGSALDLTSSTVEHQTCDEHLDENEDVYVADESTVYDSDRRSITSLDASTLTFATAPSSIQRTSTPGDLFYRNKSTSSASALNRLSALGGDSSALLSSSVPSGGFLSAEGSISALPSFLEEGTALAQNFEAVQAQLSTTPAAVSSKGDELVSYDYENYSHVNHRLKLYLSMKLLADDEELALLLRVGEV
jgi:hypothetical protein